MSPVAPPPDPEVERVVRSALREDLGDAGDLTTDRLIPPDVMGSASIRAEEELIVSGLPVAMHVFRILDPRVSRTAGARDGDRMSTGDLLLRLEGPARALLTGERTALNLIARLSGIAGVTARAVRAVAGTGTRIYDTRKTTPGMRQLEKYAVRCGGGENHRLGLHDMALIKENHIAVVGGVGEAVRRARASLPAGIRLQVEVTGLAELDEALDAGAELVLLDNMSREAMAEAVRRAAGRAELEASGGIDPADVGELARTTGVDRISLGALTRRAPWAEISMDLEIPGNGR